MTTFATPISLRSKRSPSLCAADLMTANPLAFDKDMPIPSACDLLQLNDLEAAPVVDEENRPIGVVTRESFAAWKEFSLRSSPRGSVWEEEDRTPVWQISSPIVESIAEEATASEVMQRLFRSRGRRLYVVDPQDKLVGVVSMTDLFRGLLGYDHAEQAM